MNLRPLALGITLLALSPVLPSAPVAFAADAPKDRFATRISLDLLEADAGETLRTFAGILDDTDFVVEPVTYRRLSIRLDNVTVGTALSAVCESIGCRWRVEPSPPGASSKVTVFITREPDATLAGEQGATGASGKLGERMDLSLRDADVAAVLEAFARFLGAKPNVDPSLRGRTLTLDIQGLPASQALQRVCEIVSCRWELLPGTPEGTLLVRPAR